MIKFRKIISFILVGLLITGVLITGLTACKAKVPDNTTTFKAGTYEGEAEGYHGIIKVTVTVTEAEITDIKVEHTETEGLGDKAIEKIVDQVKANTTLNVDAVSGATYSSNGILEALTAALKAAGADVEKLKEKEITTGEVKEDIKKTADVIVIGGGGAGLAATLSAHENGASVIVIEKKPSLG